MDDIAIKTIIEECLHSKEKTLSNRVEINGKMILHNVDLLSFSKEVGNQKTNMFSMFEPFTCICGVAECSGIWDGIYTKYTKKTIEWIIPSDSGYSEILEKDRYVFSIWKYGSTINKAIGSMIKSPDYLMRQSCTCENLVRVDKKYSDQDLMGGIYTW
jgi:hypothetical protein